MSRRIKALAVSRTLVIEDTFSKPVFFSSDDHNQRVGTMPFTETLCELYGEAPPERGAFFKLVVYKRVGKIAILVYERITKSAAK